MGLGEKHEEVRRCPTTITVMRPAGHQTTTAAAGAVRKTALTTWEGIWYVLQCIALGAGYFGKIPAKKAMSDFGLTEMTACGTVLVRRAVHRIWFCLLCQDPHRQGSFGVAAVSI